MGGVALKILIGFGIFFSFMGIGLLIASWTGQFMLIFPPYILFIICTNLLCKKWDRYVIARQAKKKNLTPFECVKNSLPEYITHHCNKFRGNPAALKKFLRDCVGRELLTKACADIVFEEYKDERPDIPIGQNHERQNPENTYRNF